MPERDSHKILGEKISSKLENMIVSGEYNVPQPNIDETLDAYKQVFEIANKSNFIKNKNKL